jgi:hypothetical protein
MNTPRFDAEQLLRRHLHHDERLLWAGKPAAGLRLRRGDRFMIPFSLMWTGFFVFWEASALRGGPLFFRLWGVPFLLLGADMTVGRFFRDARRRAHTYYGVTDRRIFIISGAHRQRATTFPLQTLPALTLAEHSAGSGDVILAASDAAHVAAGGWVPKGSEVPPMLEFLSDARHVYHVILQAQGVLRSSRS